MHKYWFHHSNWARVVPTLVVVGLAFSAQHFRITEGLDRGLRDAFIRLAPVQVPQPAPSLPDVAVVAIDPRSLRAIKDWPWPRDLYANAIEELAAAGARAIAFDIDFSSPSEATRDRRFADGVRANRRVVLATFSQSQTVAGGAEMEIVNRPIPILAAAAAGLGSVMVPVDSDGVVRHAPRSSPIGGDPIPSLAREMLRLAAPAEFEERVDAAERAHDTTLVDFRRIHPAIPVVSFIDVIERRFDRAQVEGRAVFVGATAAEFQDLWATPAQPALPGVMIQAVAYRTAAAETMGEDVLASAGPLWVAGGFLAFGFFSLPRRRQSGGQRAALFLGAAVGILVVGWLVLWECGVGWPVTATLGLIAAQYALGIESLQKTIRARSAAQQSSLDVLARLGDVSVAARDDVSTSDARTSLELALELLGDVVSARGVVLVRSNPAGSLGDERLEWRPAGEPGRPLAPLALKLDLEKAKQSIRERRALEVLDADDENATVVYAPLVAGRERIGVLVVFGRRGWNFEGLHRRTIATVGSQLALTAQNLQLIDRLRETFESSIAAVAGAVEARDGYTDQHCRRLAAFSSLVGRRLGLPENEIRAMELGALLHDVGKIGVPDAILNKPGRLSDDERSVMQRHPEIGAGIVSPVIGLEETTLHCVVHHHERWDGTGYPHALAGQEIPLAARIVAVVDVWDALSSERPYKKAYTQPQVRDRLQKGRGNQFDPDLVDLFLEILDEQGEEMLELIARSGRSGLVE